MTAWWAMPMRISLFDSALSNRPEMIGTTWAGLVGSLTRFRQADVPDKRKLPAWSPAIYPDGATRKGSSVVAVSCLALDYDDGTSPEAASETWRQWDHVVHSSYSHTVAAPRFRLVLPFAAAVPVEGWQRVWEWAEQHSGLTIDTSCKDPSRLYFRPFVRRDDSPRVAYHRRGEPIRIDWRSLPEARIERLTREARSRRDTGDLHVPAGSATAEERQRYRWDPAVREGIARSLGMVVSGAGAKARAKGAQCLICGRPSVWFLIEPVGTTGHWAQCEHRNSCGWHGFIDELIVQSSGGW